MNNESLTTMNENPLSHFGVVGYVNSQVRTASETKRPPRPMTDQHRKNLSRSIKNLWATRRGLSSEHRQKISVSVKKRLAERGQVPDKQRPKVTVTNDNRYLLVTCVVLPPAAEGLVKGDQVGGNG